MTTTRTTRIPGANAGRGAVAQHDGSLPVYQCNACGGEVVWATSSRTGRKYLADVYRGRHDQRFYIARDVHTDERCAERIARADEQQAELTRIEQGRAQVTATFDRMAELRAQRDAGEIDAATFDAEWLKLCGH